MNNKIWTRGSVLIIQTAVFPYYLLFLKNIGETYSTFSLLYAVFALSSAASFFSLSLLKQKPSLEILSKISLFGLGITMFVVPLAENVFQICLVQGFMGIFQAFYKMSEKEWDKVEQVSWKKENIHQFIFQIIIVVTIISTGWILDWFSIHSLFYIASFWYIINAIFIKKKVS